MLFLTLFIGKETKEMIEWKEVRRKAKEYQIALDNAISQKEKRILCFVNYIAQ